MTEPKPPAGIQLDFASRMVVVPTGIQADTGEPLSLPIPMAVWKRVAAQVIAAEAANETAQILAAAQQAAGEHGIILPERPANGRRIHLLGD